MKYYEVGLSDRGLKQHNTLTYSFEDDLQVGQVVRVSVRNRARNGVITSKTTKPTYKTKVIDTVLPDVIPEHLISLAQWMSDYYAVELGTAIGLLLPRGAEKKRRNLSTKTRTAGTKKRPKLSNEQQSAVDSIAKQADTYLLRGVTGSGKTRVYIELAEQQRADNKATIILVPEIGLTSQMVDDVTSHLESEVFVIHSNQSEAERHLLWQQIAVSKCPIVIGPRSALFSPIKKLGLIVIDEEHEPSYKQETSPKYNAVRVAARLRQLTNATLVLGSATPTVEDFYLAETYKSVVTLTKPVQPQHKTIVDVIDIKQRDDFTRNHWLSNQLIAAIEDTLANQQQALIFHNRRGNSTSVVCQNCGWTALCPNCDLPLTHHADWAKLVCHVCNHREDVLSVCPDCKQSELVYKGAGTKELYAIVTKLFPEARVERFDSDITNKAEKLEERYSDLLAGKVDIIIGTQMVAKGLDLPKLGLVGVALADTALYLPDYTSNERTYQLINQVVGRAGRHQDGRVILQTYHPKSPAIECAIEGNWQEFYSKELKDREIGGYPPHQFLLKLTFEAKQDQAAREAMAVFAVQLRKKISDVQVLGPSPAFHHKTRTGWRWQLVIKSQDRAKLIHIARNMPAKWQFELDPISLL